MNVQTKAKQLGSQQILHAPSGKNYEELPFTDQDIKVMLAAFQPVFRWCARIVRGIGFFIATYALLSVNTYGLQTPAALGVAVGILAVGTRTKKVAYAAIGALLVMAIFPAAFFETWTHIVGRI